MVNLVQHPHRSSIKTHRTPNETFPDDVGAIQNDDRLRADLERENVAIATAKAQQALVKTSAVQEWKVSQDWHADGTRRKTIPSKIKVMRFIVKVSFFGKRPVKFN